MSCVENRVRVSEFGSLAGDSALLVPVPTVLGKRPQRLHVLAARDLIFMSNAVVADEVVEDRLLVASGWRPHRWTSRQAYEDELVRRYATRLEKKYGKKPIREQVVVYGRKLLAFDSPHETGLALDLGCGGLAPVSATAVAQRQEPLYLWLVENARRFGFTSYRPEPWHWEHRVPLDAYRAGAVKGSG